MDILFRNKHHTHPAERVVYFISIIIFTGILGAALYASQASRASFLSIFGVALTIAGAALLIGALLGFIFGIPRTLQQERLGGPLRSNQNGGGPDETQQEISYQVNTNLEQISDWLTKILVGVGLTQISSLPEAIQAYALFTAPGLGNFQSSETFSVALLLYFLVSGFLMSYLLMRLYVTGAFRQADLAAIGGKLERVENQVSELQKQVEIDARALNIVQRQLEAEKDVPSISQDEITAAIKQASPNVKAQIFYLTKDVRSQNWREVKDKPKMERTIPIFRALIESDIDDVFHLNHGQLGFALKDKSNPDWIGAEKELTKAIELRGSWRKYGWLLYEFNRAICRINMDEAFKRGEASDPMSKQLILVDLIASLHSDISNLVWDDLTIKKWIEVNHVTDELKVVA